MRLPTLAALITSLTLLSSCATNKEADNKMLDQSANYHQMPGEDFFISSEKSPHFSQSLTTDILIYPHETSTKDYFLGGWIRTVVNPSSWKYKNPKKGLRNAIK